MRYLRILMTLLALVAVATLPGPSHALAAAAPDHVHADAHVIDHAHHAMTHDHAGMHGSAMGVARVANSEHGRSSHDRSCKACAVACCAPATVAGGTPQAVSAAFATRVRPSRPIADRRLPDAARGLPLRPPTSA